MTRSAMSLRESITTSLPPAAYAVRYQDGGFFASSNRPICHAGRPRSVFRSLLAGAIEIAGHTFQLSPDLMVPVTIFSVHE